MKKYWYIFLAMILTVTISLWSFGHLVYASTPATSGRTVWLNASDNDHLYTSAGPPGSGNPNNNDNVQGWDDEDGLSNIYAIFFSGVVQPLYFSSTGINSLGSLQFDGNSDNGTAWNDSISIRQGLGSYISASSYTIFIAFNITADATNNAAIYDNTSLLSQEGYARFGVIFKTNAGVTTIYAYNHDGSAESVGIDVTKSNPHVVMIRHESGNLYISVDNSAEQSVASGDTSSLAADGYLNIALDGFSGTRFFQGQIGEILMYNTALSGTNLTDTYRYMTDKWLPGAAVTSSASQHKLFINSKVIINKKIIVQ